jgi:hypothetical protein
MERNPHLTEQEHRELQELEQILASSEQRTPGADEGGGG